MELEPQPLPSTISNSSEAPFEFAEPSIPLDLPSKAKPSLDLKPIELAPDTNPPLEFPEKRRDYRHRGFDFQLLNHPQMRTPRIQVGLLFSGLGALGLMVLLLYIRAMHPEFDGSATLREYWGVYIGWVSLGVTGLIVLGREAMRS